MSSTNPSLKIDGFGRTHRTHADGATANINKELFHNLGKSEKNKNYYDEIQFAKGYNYREIYLQRLTQNNVNNRAIEFQKLLEQRN